MKMPCCSAHSALDSWAGPSGPVYTTCALLLSEFIEIFQYTVAYTLLHARNV